MRLLLTRHAETKENTTGIVMGNDCGEISEKGHMQISKFINKLKKEKIDLIISSDSKRCCKTAREILKKIKAPIIYSKSLREKDNGDWVGKNRKEIDWSILGEDFEKRKPQNGESLRDVKERTKDFFQKILKKHSDKTLLIISHGCFLKVFIGDLLNMSLYDSIFKLRIDYCSISEVEAHDANNHIVIRINNLPP